MQSKPIKKKNNNNMVGLIIGIIVLIIIGLCIACYMIKTLQERTTHLEQAMKHTVSDEFHSDYMAQFVTDFGLQAPAPSQ